MAQRITILGSGAMGTACACILAHSGRQVRLWSRNADYSALIERTRENSRLLPGVRLPSDVLVTACEKEALADADVVVVCIPTRGIREAFARLSPIVPERALIVSAAKGIENSTLLRPSEILQEALGQRPIVALGGPCHAEEVSRHLPASIVAASEDLSAAETIQNLFSTDYLRVYANSDLRGVEFAGALKNVIAIAAGISDGLKYGDNTRSALMTRGLAEMVRFGLIMGAQPETFYGLAGVGDLTVTCCSQHSRNRAVGEMLGRGMQLAEIQAGMSAVAEGVFTVRSVVELADRRQLDMPIAREVYSVLFEGRSPAVATEHLMRRPLKSE
jgi:glycerol-3-phosphate dehydrogenase (NAD(P)+)